MTLWDSVIIDIDWLIFSFILLVFMWVWYVLNYYQKPSFVIPFKNINFVKYVFEKALLILILLMILIFPLNISWVVWQRVETWSTFNIQIVFDVSLSMTADDIKPSRFDSAKDSVIHLVRNMKWYNMSVIMFSGIPFVWAPFTDDTEALVSKLWDMSIADFPPTLNFVGTAIWDAILMWVKNLEDYSKIKPQPWLIIMITDWDSNRWSEPLQATSISINKKIPIYTLWIWKNDYIVWYDQFNNPVKTKINIDLLSQIANQSWWKFYRVMTDQEFKNIFDEIARYVKKEEKTVVYNEYFKLNEYVFQILLICLISFFVIRIYVLFGIVK